MTIDSTSTVHQEANTTLPPKPFHKRVAEMLHTQSPANFALVMSTGIVSVALHLLNFHLLAWILFYCNMLFFVVLIPLYCIRLLAYPKSTFSDFTSHAKGPGFLTITAGSCILGNQYALLAHDLNTALFFFWMGVCTWIVFIWGVFSGIFMRNPKPPMEEGINGAWLLATVSTQALVILGSILLNRSGWPTEIALFCLVVLFFVGIALYAVVITMIVYRYTFKELLPKHFSPTYWINTGAMAITTLAGAELISHISHSYFLLELAPFLKGATLMAWGVATWWLPILFILGFWRYAVKKYPFTYTPEYWGMVFPMGMYTACTVMLSEVFELHFLMIIPEYFIFIACFAWGATFAGMIWSLIKGVLNIGMAIQ